MRKELASHLPTPCYYPGTQAKYDLFRKEYESDAIQINYEGALESHAENVVPPLFVSDISKKPNLFQNVESFCPVMGVLPIDVPDDPSSFCDAAVKFVNESVWGNLSTTIFVSPITLSRYRDVIQHAVDRMEIGAVGVNIWGGTCVLFPHLHWGAYPGLGG